jgi:hypothetical protein
MIVEIALGILLALLLLGVGIAALIGIVRSLPVILAYVASVGSLWALHRFLGDWGIGLFFVLLIGFICVADREAIFKPASTDKGVTPPD